MKSIRLLLGLAALLCTTSAGSQNNASQVLASKAHDVMEQRCIVCHGCYDAPCQLKLESDEGLQRGASKTLVYDGERLRAANLTRLCLGSTWTFSA